jgi:hypothetical protein
MLMQCGHNSITLVPQRQSSDRLAEAFVRQIDDDDVKLVKLQKQMIS